MADAAISVAIEVSLKHLITFFKEQIRLVRDFKKDFDNLKKSFDIVKAILHYAEEKQVTNTAVKVWLKELQDLDFEADNFFDDISYYQLLYSKVGPTRNKTVMEKVQSFFYCSSNDPTRLELGRRIKDIKENLLSINKQAREFGLQTCSILNSQPPVSAIPPETNSITVDPIFFGRQNDVSMIVEKLTTATGQVLSVLPIVGMGGLGKTTLARKVFLHEQIISHFEGNRIWVHGARDFDVPNLLKNILASLTNEKVYPETREALLNKLQQHLRTGRYLLVLDDVWDEERGEWENLVNSLSGISSATGNCMIVTTRSQKIVSIVRTLQKYELGYLSEDDCWSIIKAKAFIDSGDVPTEFESVGRNIAKRCRGSPLAAKVVGGLLRDKSKDEWQNIEMNKLPDFGDDHNTISKILKLSFDYLSSPSLKKCFAYCFIFPKGYRIEKQGLIELWMAEGFLEIDHQGSYINMETTGSKNLDILLWNSLLQVAHRDDYGNVTHCNMHDLVHDLAKFVVRENRLFQSRRYIGYESNGVGLLSIPKGHEKYVRTLFFSVKVSDIIFSNFKSLHSLTLVGEEDIDELPTSIRELKHLRYLDISGTRIRSLPDSIGELYHMHTLRTQNKGGHSYLKRLPNSVSCLISLRHLHIHDSTILPPEIGKLTSLRTLPHIRVGSEKGYGVSELENLKDLEGKLEICNLEKVCDKTESMSANLHQKRGICELRLVWGVRLRKCDEENDESVLEGLKPHPNLQRLEICGFKGKNLSLWDGLNNVMEIKLENCSECEELSMLGHLPCLKSLYLIDLTNLKSIRSSFYGNIDNDKRDTIVVMFPELERLELRDMPNLEEWYEVFPRLKYLKIYGCMQLTRAPSQFQCLEELEIVSMESSLALENICGIELTSLTRLKIEDIEGLECLPDWLFSNNHNLRKLEISDCPNMMHLVPRLGGGGAPSLLKELKIWDCSSLRELPNDLHNLNSLQRLYIRDCPKLKFIPHPISSGGGQQEHGFTSLRNLYISDCKELANLPIEMIKLCAPSLESLTLIGLSNMTNLGMVIGCLHKMTLLRELWIKEFPIKEFPRLSNEDINGSLSLQKLEMGPFSDSSWNNISFNETVGTMLPQLIISLRTLILTGKEHWDSLPNQLQHITSLENLDLWSFGIETLPDWFGNLSSLKRLTLSDCKKLRHLPSKQAMQRLCFHQLTHLDINRCPLLLKEGNNNNNNPEIVDSEWPKISHIPCVQVDRRRVSSDGHGH